MNVTASYKYSLGDWNIGEDMPAVSKKQRRFMAMCEHGVETKKPCPKMSKSKMHDYASTKEKGLKKRKKSEWSKLTAY